MIKNKNYLLIIFLIALLLRLIYVLLYPQYPVEMDAENYNRIATNLAEGKGYTSDGLIVSTKRPPGYTFFLASIFYIFGENIIIVRLFQAIISSMIVVFIYLIAKKCFNKKVVYVSALLYAIYFPSIFYSGLLLTETLYSFLLIIAFYFLLVKNINNNNSLIVGIFFGVISLVRSTSILLPFFIIFLFLMFNRNKKYITSFGLIILIMFAVIIPWSIINYKVYNRFFLINTIYGLEIWTTTHPSDLHYSGDVIKELAKLEPQMRNMNPLEQSDFLLVEAKKNLLNNPMAYFKMTLKRFYRLWLGSHTNNVVGLTPAFGEVIATRNFVVLLAKIFLLIFNILIVILGFIGIFLFLKNKEYSLFNKILLTSPIFYTILLHGFFYATSRYSIPVMPFMIIFSSYTLHYLFLISRRLITIYN